MLHAFTWRRRSAAAATAQRHFIRGSIRRSEHDPTYLCPDCKTPLNAFYCSDCEYEFPRLGEIPRLLSRDRGFAQTEQVAAAYDAIYADRSNVWANQGRTPEFIAYFSALVDRLPHARSLEIGCGEGFLLAARNGGEKFAVDLSI